MKEFAFLVAVGVAVVAIVAISEPFKGLLIRAAANLGERREARIKRRFKKLSPRQQKFLVDFAEHHGGRALISDGVCRQRWFEEFVEWNYLEYVNPMILPFDGTSTYQITPNGIKQIEK